MKYSSLTLEKEFRVSAKENTRLVQSEYEAFGRGDMATDLSVRTDHWKDTRIRSHSQIESQTKSTGATLTTAPDGAPHTHSAGMSAGAVVAGRPSAYRRATKTYSRLSSSSGSPANPP